MGSRGAIPTTTLQSQQPTVVMSLPQAQAQNADVFSDTDNGNYVDLYNGRQYYLNQTFNIDTMMAIQDYLNDQPVSGSLYSPSQELNYAMEHSLNLTANQEFMKDALNDGMHNLGYNLNLEHYGRVGYIDSFGRLAGVNINSSNFGNMTEAQLKQAFVGLAYTEDKFVSTSYNHFKNAPNGGRPFTDKAVKFNIKAPANAQALMPGNGPGGQLGEIVLKPGQNFRITDVRYTGKSGRSGAGTYKQVEFDVEIF